MTMHLLPAMYSTTGKKKAKFKYASAEHKACADQLASDWQDLLKRQGMPKEQPRHARSMDSSNYVPPKISQRGSELLSRPSRNSGQGVAAKAAVPMYTGTKVLGISTLHKSNGIPVFSQEEAVEISKMRRG